jgi:hypothetical protein
LRTKVCSNTFTGMGAYPKYTDVDRARSWLIQQRLPHHDGDVVALVAARLAARRKGRWFDGLILVGLLAAYLLWLAAVDDDESGFLALLLAVFPFAAVMSIEVLRRSVLWWRHERDAAAQLRGRVTTLDRRPTWSELLGWPALVLLAGLASAALATTATAAPGPNESSRESHVVMVVSGIGYCLALLELARRRSMLARDAVTLAADRRLRVEEAGEAASLGALFIAVFPMTTSENGTAMYLLLAGYGLVLLATWWHARQARADGVVVAPGGAS